MEGFKRLDDCAIRDAIRYYLIHSHGLEKDQIRSVFLAVKNASGIKIAAEVAAEIVIKDPAVNLGAHI